MSSKADEGRPNIFRYATSELSQDAMLCWLAAWADKKSAGYDEQLYRLGQSFVMALLRKAGRDESVLNVTSVEVKRQHNWMDIILIINSSFVILIEDKAGATDHSDQLTGYYQALLGCSDLVNGKTLSKEDIVPIYLQTYEQGDLVGVRKAGYTLFDRKDLLDVLSPYKSGANSIIQDFYEHLNALDQEFEAFVKLELEKWPRRNDLNCSWRLWEGFFSRLKKEMKEGWWRYIPNPSGGFHCFGWNPDFDISNSDPYIQLEMERLCFKIEVDNVSERRQKRDYWMKKILSVSQESGLNVMRPSKLGNGTAMTVACLDYRVAKADRTIDIGRTIAKLHEAEDVLRRAIMS